MKRPLTLCGLALVLALAFVSGGVAATTPTVSVTPNPVVLDPVDGYYGFITVSGCGYSAGESLSAVIQSSITLSATANAAGCFTVYYSATYYGLNTLAVYPVKQGNRKVVASTTFLVVASP